MVSEADRHALRATFEEVAELYDRARPGYPAALFDDLVALTRLPERGRIAEIGCGTGQATVPLAARGFEIVCVEFGERLAAIARRNLAPFPQVEVVTAAFESWEPGTRGFDAVVAFTSFHWLDPDARFEKSAAILRGGGGLAVVETRHVLPDGGDPFWAGVQEDYDAVVPSEDNRPPPQPDEVGDLGAEIRASGLFGEAVVRRHVWEVSYTADEYISVLDTYSPNRPMAEAARRDLYGRIRRRVQAQPGGVVTKTYLATLNVAERL